MDRKTLLKALYNNPGNLFVPVVAAAGSSIMYLKVNRFDLYKKVRDGLPGETGYSLIERAGVLYLEASDAVDAEIEAKVDLSQAPVEEETAQAA